RSPRPLTTTQESLTATLRQVAIQIPTRQLSQRTVTEDAHQVIVDDRAIAIPSLDLLQEDRCELLHGQLIGTLSLQPLSLDERTLTFQQQRSRRTTIIEHRVLTEQLTSRLEIDG